MAITINRREVLLGLSGFGLGSVASCAAADAQLPVRAIPGTDESLPIVGLGSTKPVRFIAEAGTGPLEDVIGVLMRYGGRVVDTSPRPAGLDEQFGRVLQQPALRKLFVAAKVKVEGREEGIASMRQTLELFGRDPLDLMQIESMIDYETQWPTLKAMRDRGEVRYIGVTVAHERLYGELEAFMQKERPDFVQLNYSVMEHSAEERLLPLAAALGIAVLVNGPFMNGEYFGFVQGRDLPPWAGEFGCESWAQFSLKYILANPAVTCVLTETTKPEHMEDNVRAGLGPLPDAGARQRMRALAAELRAEAA